MKPLILTKAVIDTLTFRQVAELEQRYNMHEILVRALAEARDWVSAVGDTLPDSLEDFVTNSFEDIDSVLSAAMARVLP